MSLRMLALSVVFSAIAWADQGISAPNFRSVEDGIFRSGRPTAEDYAAFKQMGVRMVIDLENDMKAVQSEKAMAAAHGIEFVTIPMASWATPHKSDVDKALSLLRDQNNYPLLIHCKHGQDRTGMVVGLYRVEAEGVSPQAAYHEMKTLGFHSGLIFLDAYFRKRTGL